MSDSFQSRRQLDNQYKAGDGDTTDVNESNEDYGDCVKADNDDNDDDDNDNSTVVVRVVLILGQVEVHSVLGATLGKTATMLLAFLRSSSWLVSCPLHLQLLH